MNISLGSKTSGNFHKARELQKQNRQTKRQTVINDKNVRENI